MPKIKPKQSLRELALAAYETHLKTSEEERAREIRQRVDLLAHRVKIITGLAPTSIDLATETVELEGLTFGAKRTPISGEHQFDVVLYVQCHECSAANAIVFVDELADIGKYFSTHKADSCPACNFDND